MLINLNPGGTRLQTTYYIENMKGIGIADLDFFFLFFFFFLPTDWLMCLCNPIGYAQYSCISKHTKPETTFMLDLARQEWSESGHSS